MLPPPSQSVRRPLSRGGRTPGSNPQPGSSAAPTLTVNPARYRLPTLPRPAPTVSLEVADVGQGAVTKRCFAVDSFTDEAGLRAALAAQGVGLTPFEARRLAELLGRNPTLTELQIFNAEWSEHCSYKSSRPTLKEFLPTEGPTVIQGPQEDAGILLLCDLPDGDRWGIVIAHESHNHPCRCCLVRARRRASAGSCAMSTAWAPT